MPTTSHQKRVKEIGMGSCSKSLKSSASLLHTPCESVVNQTLAKHKIPWKAKKKTTEMLYSGKCNFGLRLCGSQNHYLSRPVSSCQVGQLVEICIQPGVQPGFLSTRREECNHWMPTTLLDVFIRRHRRILEIILISKDWLQRESTVQY